MSDPRSYGEIFADMIDDRAKYDDRGEIFRQLDISRNQFYNCTNPNRTTSGGNPYPFPMEWMVRATREFKQYDLIRAVSKDCGGVFISFDEVKELETSNVANVLDMVKNILGRVCNKKRT